MNPTPIPPRARASYPWARALVIGKPPGYTDDEIGGLPALIDRSEPRFPTIRSYWKPSPEELTALNAGAHIELSVIAAQMVPVALNVRDLA